VLSTAWRSEARTIAALALVAALIGAIVDALSFCFFIATLAYLAWHLRNVYRLLRWLERSRTGYPPDASGVWGIIFKYQSDRQREHRERKRRLTRILVRFQQSTRAIPDGLVLLDDQNQIEWTNHAATELLGVSAPRDSGQRIENFVRLPEFRAFIADDSTPACIVRAPAAATRFLEVRRVSFGDRNKLLIAHDATERFAVEQMRKDFVADVSHELRTPLTVLSGYMENMNRDPDSVPQMWQRPIKAMTEQSARMRMIVEDLLLLARMEGSPSGKEETVDVARLAAQLARDARELSGEREHQVVLQVDAELLLCGVRAELQTAFSNLVSNAIRYTPDKGSITLRWYAESQNAYFAVEDTGEGIDERYIPRLTERFFRVDKGRSREQGGTGLGLSIVRHILDRHAAVLEVTSVVDQGTIFRCKFPLSKTVRSAAVAEMVSAATAD